MYPADPERGQQVRQRGTGGLDLGRMVAQRQGHHLAVISRREAVVKALGLGRDLEMGGPAEGALLVQDLLGEFVLA